MSNLLQLGIAFPVIPADCRLNHSWTLTTNLAPSETQIIIGCIQTGYWVKLKFKYGCAVVESTICTDIPEVDDVKVTYSIDVNVTMKLCKCDCTVPQIIIQFIPFLSVLFSLSLPLPCLAILPLIPMFCLWWMWVQGILYSYTIANNSHLYILYVFFIERLGMLVLVCGHQ